VRERLKADPWIAEATVQKFYPGELRIDIVERSPFALWQQDGRLSLIADDGAVLEPYVSRRFISLPLVVGKGAESRARDFLALLARYPQVRAVTSELGLGMLGLGFHPTARREDVPWMPKRRYAVMRRYMPLKGKLGHDMMLRTCTVQVNLDFESEADMVRKTRMSLALQPIAVALFAASPFVEGKPSGYLSYRSHVWTDVDPDRTGMLPFVFEPGFGFERYVDYMLDVPMYFVYRDGAGYEVEFVEPFHCVVTLERADIRPV